jgi:hypothetical protein
MWYGHNTCCRNPGRNKLKTQKQQDTNGQQASRAQMWKSMAIPQMLKQQHGMKWHVTGQKRCVSSYVMRQQRQTTRSGATAES